MYNSKKGNKMKTYLKYKETKGNVLVVGDLHIPAEHQGYLRFIKLVYKTYECTRVVFIGDIVDHHASSYHEPDPDLQSAGDELDEVRRRLKKWGNAFPEALVCIGNHDAIPARKLKTAGLPSSLLKNENEIYGTPKTWDWHSSFILDDVLYKHFPEGGSTLTGQLRGAERNGMSTVTGHTHSVGGVAYSAGYKNTVFALATGCGIDRHHKAFAYGANSRFKPIIGCGVVFDGGFMAQFIPMDLKAFNGKRKLDV